MILFNYYILVRILFGQSIRKVNMAFNWVDYVFLAIFFISILGGLLRGGVREVISLLTWIAAFIVAGFFAKPLAKVFTNSEGTQHVMSSASSGVFGGSAASQVTLFSLGASFVLLFIVTIIVGSLFGYFANRVVEGGGISFFNRLLGGIFGLGRGYLVNLFIIFMVQLSPLAEQNYWHESFFVQKFQPTVQWLGDKIQPGLESLKSRVGKTLEDMSSGTENAVMGVYQ